MTENEFNNAANALSLRTARKTLDELTACEPIVNPDELLAVKYKISSWGMQIINSMEVIEEGS